MDMQVFAIFDDKGGHYGVPFFCHTQGVALRMFHDLVNDHNSAVCQHPEDYILFALGSWCDQTAMFTQEKTQVVCRASEMTSVQPLVREAPDAMPPASEE